MKNKPREISVEAEAQGEKTGKNKRVKEVNVTGKFTCKVNLAHSAQRKSR